MQPGRSAVAKVILAVVTLVLFASQIGIALVPFLAPAHIWAARRSSRVGQWLWTLLPALGVGALTGAATYVAAGEPKPAIWLLPAVAMVVSWTALQRIADAPGSAHVHA